jgi:hypothetical protein
MRQTRGQALRPHEHGQRRHRRTSVRQARGERRPTASLTSAATPVIIDLALRAIDELPPVRLDVVDAASTRLAAGERPSAEAIAEMAIRHASSDQRN